ncbi:hypothetical protein C7H84_28055 [Burkholderia sp. Nafp2/4-1b]|uniref:hypothetical protein n=1 Tax=Burkholderia sp. Nafp2/4-1b TaxID=2116686 RepID=UPI000EF9600F|nr:hypothetical protein [Burkholderia sp. Nafp2/4-1b]RKU00346.1 hypothetical protein C7H84_28055 [Burkholderia sp. Nafp2/4-1b]
MKPITWIVMSAVLALTACGGGDVTTKSPSQSTPTNPGSPSGPSSPGGGSSGGPTGGGPTQTPAGWSAAVAVDGKGPEGDPSVTIDASGNALATWMTYGPTGATGNEMWGARYVAGSGWQSATRLDTGDGSHSMNGLTGVTPQLVGNASGQAVAFWTEWMPGPNTYALWARPYSPATGWGTASELAPDMSGSSYTAGIDGQGNALVAWTQSISLLDTRIAWTRYTQAGQWSPTALVQMPVQTGPGAVTGDTDNVGPRLSVLSSGRAVLAWRQTNHTQSALWTATYDATNGWTDVNQAVSDTSLFTTIISPVAGMDAKGNITLVWGELDVTGGKLTTTTMAQRFVAGTGWQAAVPVAPAITEPTGFIAAPMLTVNDNGIAAVMWAEGGAVLQASVADASGNWGPLQRLTEHLNGAAAQYPQLVIDAAGNATAAWQDTGLPGASAVIAASYRNGAWSASTVAAQSASWPVLAVNATGSMALVWQSYVPSIGSQLQSSFYTPGA